MCGNPTLCGKITWNAKIVFLKSQSYLGICLFDKKDTNRCGWVWWPMPLIAPHRRQRQVYLYDFKVSVVSIVKVVVSQGYI